MTSKFIFNPKKILNFCLSVPSTYVKLLFISCYIELASGIYMKFVSAILFHITYYKFIRSKRLEQTSNYIYCYARMLLILIDCGSTKFQFSK